MSPNPEIKLVKVKEIINNFRKQGEKYVLTIDVIRKYQGYFISNAPTPNFNKAFGKTLKKYSNWFNIKEVDKSLTVQDDNGKNTSSSKWQIMDI